MMCICTLLDTRTIRLVSPRGQLEFKHARDTPLETALVEPRERLRSSMFLQRHQGRFCRLSGHHLEQVRPVIADASLLPRPGSRR